MAERRRKSSLHCAVRHNFTSSRGDSRSSLNLQKPCLWSRFIPLTLHSTCEVAHFIRLWSFLPSGVLIVFPFLLRFAYTAALPPWFFHLRRYLIISKVLFLCLAGHGGRSEKAGKFLSSPNGLFRFLPTFYPQKSSILTEVVGEENKMAGIFSSLTKILWSFFHKTWRIFQNNRRTIVEQLSEKSIS